MDIEKIIKKMTLREKLLQLSQIMISEKNIDEMKEIIENDCYGSLILAAFSTTGNGEFNSLELEKLNEIQRIAVEKHGIPIIYGHDVIHGYKINLPIPLALAATFNPQLVKKGYEYVAMESRNDGIRWTFAPMLDVSRDPRWGRIVESTGEDPYLGCKMAEAVVKGFQGDDNTNIAACAKHYIGYGASEGGRDYHKTEISDYSLRNYYLRAFKAAVDSGVMTVMSSFNEISGQPVSSSKYLLTDVLRHELGFDGFVISDWEAVKQLIRQGVAENSEEAAVLALNAGLDMDMVDNLYIDNLEKAVNDGKISEDTVDTAVRRVLKVKDKLGLFDNPYAEHIDLPKSEIRDIARKCAAESLVLLKNDNDVLPLKKEETICVMGSMAFDTKNIVGSWTADADYSESVSVYDGLTSKSSKIIQYNCHAPELYTTDNPEICDKILVVLGEAKTVTGEANSIAKIELTPAQKYVIDRAKETGKPVIGVLMFGRPIALENNADSFDALIYAWHPGAQAGNAIADVLFGDVSPSGRLPVTLPKHSGQIPIYYNCPPSGRDVDGYYNPAANNYRDITGRPLYPFGYGLTYTKFEYGIINIDKTCISVEELNEGTKVTLSIDIHNTGCFDAAETVQCYIRACKSSMTRPIKELKGFDKLFISAGESKTAHFEIGYDELGFYNASGRFVVEPGEFKIYAGKDAWCNDCVLLKIN